MTELREHLYRYTVAYLRIHGEARPCEAVASFRRMFPIECKGYTDQVLRSKLTGTITKELNYYGPKAPIQRTGYRTIRLKEGFTWLEE